MHVCMPPSVKEGAKFEEQAPGGATRLFHFRDLPKMREHLSVEGQHPLLRGERITTVCVPIRIGGLDTPSSC